MNGNYSDSAPSRGQHYRRLPSVEDAIQYSPFTSIVPFDTENVQIPFASPSSTTSSTLTPHERSEIAQTVKVLDKEASLPSPGNDSASVDVTIRKLQTLLNPTELTQFKFKIPPQLHQGKPNDREGLSSSRSSHRHESQLGPFARMALDATGVEYTYPTPISPARSPAKNGWKRQDSIDRKSSVPSPPRVATHSVENVEFNLQEPGFDVDSIYETAHRQHGGPSVMVPRMPLSSNLAEYQEFPELDASIIRGDSEHSRKRKRDEQEAEDIGIDQREKAEEALRELQDLMSAIFEAEDQLEPDTSGQNSTTSNDYFTAEFTEEGTTNILLPKPQTKFDTALQNVIKANAFARANSEDLLRVQRLCARSISSADEDGLKLPDDDHDDSLTKWESNLYRADNSLISSRILLRIAIAAEGNTQLRSEELLQELLKNFKAIIEGCVVPIVELRSSSAPEFLQSHDDRRAILSKLLQRAARIVRMIGELLMQVDLSENTITTIEFISTKLLFVENATSEKESLLGIPKFEAARRYAMDVVARVFLRRPEQRSFIFDEILSSLEKLPTSRQGSKHFKTSDGKAIRVVSALFMQLIQTSTIPSKLDLTAHGNEEAEQQSASDPSSDEDYNSQDEQTRKPKKKIGKMQRSQLPSLTQLGNIANPLFESAQNSANYVVTYLVNRALATTKSGDEPYRQLLDDFAEDFISVLGHIDWPGAEVLLKILLTRLINVAEGDKSTAPARNMALELMGRMGSAITELHSYTERTFKSFNEIHQPFVKNLSELCSDTLEGNLLDTDLLKRNGPYRAVLDHLQSSEQDELSAQSARHYCLTQWGRSVLIAAEGASVSQNANGDDGTLKDLALTADWLVYQFQHRSEVERLEVPIEGPEARLCFSLIVLNLTFCRALSRIMAVFMASVSSQHATVRNRALKSVVQVLEKDPSMLKRSSHIKTHILRAAHDPSALVRESALGLIGKCITLDPELEGYFLKTLVDKTCDAGTQVRKRSMKLLKETYTRNTISNVRPSITGAILERLSDMEESVVELARQIIEEILIAPFQGVSPSKQLSAQTRQEVQQHVHLLIATAQHGGDSLASVLEELFRDALKVEHKNSFANQDMSKVLVGIMFDMIIDNDAAAGSVSQSEVLQTLTIFAKASPELFSAEQMHMLKPYINNLANSEDVLIYRSVVVIYRCVLPVLPPLQHTFLSGVQEVLLKSISRLAKAELNEVAICLSIIDKVLQNTDRLVNLLISILSGIEKEKKANLHTQADSVALNRLKRYMTIAGYFGKACDLQAYKEAFVERIPHWKVDTISGLVVDIICQFTDSKQPHDIREQALESIGLVCQSWPKNFMKQSVNSAIQTVFREQSEPLELVVLVTFKAFYNTEEQRFKGAAENTSENGNANGEKKLAKSMIQSDNDGASASIAQQYTHQILRIALRSVDHLALVATEVIASIGRQGLVHPKEYAAAVVVLETSPNQSVSKIAFDSHKDLQQKHESVLEKEYVRAVEQTFVFQRDVVKDVSGVDSEKTPKLQRFYEAIKTSSSIVHRKKLLANLCATVNIDPAKLGQRDEAKHLEYARFVIENLSLFDYGRADELIHLTACLEKTFKSVGNTISQRIEKLLNLSLEPEQGNDALENAGGANQTLCDLTAASVVLSMMWEMRTYLRRTWTIPQARETKQKGPPKDLNKPPVKSPSAAPDKHLERLAKFMNSLAAEDAMKDQCRAFVELVSVDQELTVGSEEDDETAMRFATPSSDGATEGTPVPMSGGSKASKRKGIGSAGSTPKKPKGDFRRPSVGRRKSSAGKSWDVDDHDGGWD